ncbi:MAG: MBL fold metallo-hydrolase [Actinomycetales bacterium]|nr:MBL fold metallo-hydrolase [Actinomycetales bacterium]
MRSLVEVAPGVHVATAAMWATTTTVVTADDGACLLVDPAVTVDDVHGLAETLAVLGWRPVAGFSTHPHWDHVLWSARLGDPARWATPEACRVARERREQILRDADTEAPGHDHVAIGRLTALPTGAGEPSSGVRLPWSGPTALVLPHSAHCPGSAALVLPDPGVICVGDLLSDREVPLLDLDAPDPVGDHLRALEVVEAAIAAHGVRVVVPGHGTVTDAEGARRRAERDRAYLAALVAGDPIDDDRLDDPWVAGEHERQVTWAAARQLPRL